MGGPSQTITRDKVFCKECLYLAKVGGNTQWPPVYVCDHPENRNSKYDTWYAPHVGQKTRPQRINKKNDCSWFEKRGGGKKLL